MSASLPREASGLHATGSPELLDRRYLAGEASQSSEVTVMSKDQQVARWRDEAAEDNPAGPLYSHGIYAEADIVSEVSEVTGLPCGGSTGCTGSRTTLCC